MSTDRALELAESALHDRRSYAKYHGLPALEAECEEALKIVADIRASMLSEALESGAKRLQEVKEGRPTGEPSESLRTAEND